MEEVILCNAVTMFPLISQKALPFHVLFIVTEIGLSGGDYVSLGWHEKEDLRVAVSFLRSEKQVSRIGLWGRSMGAVTSLLYGAEDPSVAGMVVDSAFSNLFNLMLELVDVYKIRLPKFTVKMALQYMRRAIQKKAKFDIMDLNAVQFAPKTFIPALFGHASEDVFIQPRHSDLIYEAYAGDKNIIKFEGDHNSPRPQFYYDSVSIFFYNVLHPPQITSTCSSKLDTYYDIRDLKVGTGTDESVLYEIITGLRAAGSDATSSSSVPPIITNCSTTKSVVELLSESVAQLSVDKDIDFLLDQDDTINMTDGSCAKESHLQDKSSGANEELCSNSSSNRESWGRCSSLGGSEGSSSTECPVNSDSRRQRALRALATPLRRIHRKSAKPKEKKQLSTPTLKKPKRDQLEKGDKLSPRLRQVKQNKLEKGDTLSQRLRLCLTGRANHGRHRSP